MNLCHLCLNYTVGGAAIFLGQINIDYCCWMFLFIISLFYSSFFMLNLDQAGHLELAQMGYYIYYLSWTGASGVGGRKRRGNIIRRRVRIVDIMAKMKKENSSRSRSSLTQCNIWTETSIGGRQPKICYKNWHCFIHNKRPSLAGTYPRKSKRTYVRKWRRNNCKTMWALEGGKRKRVSEASSS